MSTGDKQSWRRVDPLQTMNDHEDWDFMVFTRLPSLFPKQGVDKVHV